MNARGQDAVDVTNAGGALAPGMYCEVEWPAAKKN